jgi:predicted DCC family thiol-disulfide oxidoreductase YuxK
MKKLHVLYDARCDMCRSCTRWLMKQEQVIPLEFIPAQNFSALARFPDLDRRELLDELHVISDEGELYRGADAWIICLYALKEYRGWSQRLASPALRPFAQRVLNGLRKPADPFGDALVGVG